MSLFGILSVAVFGLLLLNTLFYPNLSVNYLGISSIWITIFYWMVTIAAEVMGKKSLPDKMLRFNRKIIFPFLIISAILLVIWENNNYDNYVLSTFRIHLWPYLYLALSSGALFFSSFEKINKSRGKYWYYLMPVLLLLLAYIQVENPALFSKITSEDQVLELGQFGMYLLAGGMSIVTARLIVDKRDWRRVFLMLMGIGFVFIAFEEISWGQRFLEIDTPEEVGKINMQNEINLHNLKFFQYEPTYYAYMAIGLWGSVVSLLTIKFFGKKGRNWEMLTVPEWLFGYFLIIFLVYFIRTFMNFSWEIAPGKTVTVLPWMEAGETFLAMGFLGYSLANWSRIKK